MSFKTFHPDGNHTVVFDGTTEQRVYLDFPGIIHGFTTLRKAIPSGQNDLEAFLDAVKLMVERHR